MFTQRRTRSMGGAIFTTAALIYHQTVQNLRKTHRNAVLGLVLTMLQASIMIGAFFLMYVILGVRAAPALAAVVDAATVRALWLVEGVRGGPAPAEDGRLRAVVAVRDAAVHAEAATYADTDWRQINALFDEPIACCDLAAERRSLQPIHLVQRHEPLKRILVGRDAGALEKGALPQEPRQP